MENLRKLPSKGLSAWGLLAGLAIAPIVVAACSSSGTNATDVPHGPATIQARHTALGSIITDQRSLTVYLFERDNRMSSTCYGACAATWPPVLTAGAPHSTTSVAASLLGTTARSNGTTQVTFAGYPLYYFSGDHNPGDVTGQGLQNFGGGWDALTPNGQKVESSGH